MWWWLAHSLKVGALNVTYGGVTQITQVVGVVALLTWELIEAKVSRLSMRWWLSFSVGVDLDDPTTNVCDVAP